MNNIGLVERRLTKGKPDAFMGEFSISTLTGDIAIVPHPGKRSENSPDYLIKFRPQVRGAVWSNIGNAWVKQAGVKADEIKKKTLLKLDHRERFLSITLDSPDLPDRLNISAFPADDETGDKGDAALPGVYNLVWGRPRRNRAGGASAPADAGPAVGDDDIPY